MEDWPLADPPNVMLVTARQIIDGTEPILLACRDADDGSWQFLTGGSANIADGKLVTLRCYSRIWPAPKNGST